MENRLKAQYVWRLDDIHSAMDWKKFWTCMGIFKEAGIVPLLGIIPDCRDQSLMVDRPDYRFWDTLRRLLRDGEIEIAQHGYQHLLVASDGAILGRRYGFQAISEFAGLPFDMQLDKIAKGRTILEREKLASEVWMAPAHSFDRETLLAIKSLGFKYVTDGIALFPYESYGLTFVPQQLFRPRRAWGGNYTVCLHTNTADDRLYCGIRRLIRSGARSVRFSEASGVRCDSFAAAANKTFETLYMLARSCQRLFGRKRPTLQREAR